MSFAELFMVALVAVLVIKPSDWPIVIRFVTKLSRKVRALLTDIQQQADAMVEQAALGEREQLAQKVDKLYQHKND
jgi:Sec-independent protein translocase protein TatA